MTLEQLSAASSEVSVEGERSPGFRRDRRRGAALASGGQKDVWGADKPHSVQTKDSRGICCRQPRQSRLSDMALLLFRAVYEATCAITLPAFLGEHCQLGDSCESHRLSAASPQHPSRHPFNSYSRRHPLPSAQAAKPRRPCSSLIYWRPPDSSRGEGRGHHAAQAHQCPRSRTLATRRQLVLTAWAACYSAVFCLGAGGAGAPAGDGSPAELRRCGRRPAARERAAARGNGAAGNAGMGGVAQGGSAGAGPRQERIRSCDASSGRPVSHPAARDRQRTHGSGGASDQTRLGMPNFSNLLQYAGSQGVTLFETADAYGAHPTWRRRFARSDGRT